MKSGTTSLHQHLDDHPDICMSREKEPGYFVEELNWKKGERWYLDLFRHATDQRILGESSSYYTKLPTFRGVPERIEKCVPDARFIYLMRDPVKRAVSHYWHQVRSKQKGGGERRDMLTAFREDEQYLSYSHYAMQLTPYFEVFGRERIFVLTLEEFSREPQMSMRRIFSWLGVDEDFEPPSLSQKLHVSAPQLTRKRRWLARLRKTPFWEAVRVAVPPAVRRIGARFFRTRSN